MYPALFIKGFPVRKSIVCSMACFTAKSLFANLERNEQAILDISTDQIPFAALQVNCGAYNDIWTLNIDDTSFREIVGTLVL